MNCQTIRGQCPDALVDFLFIRNQSEKSGCGYCPESREQIKADIDELLALGSGALVCCYAGNELAGLAVFDMDDNGHKAEVWGPYTAERCEDSFQAVADGLIGHISGRAETGFAFEATERRPPELHFFPNKQNVLAESYLQSIGACFAGIHTTFSAMSCERHSRPDCVKAPARTPLVRPIRPNQHQDFIALHDRIFPQTYYSGSEILGRLDENRALCVTVSEGGLAGYIYTEFDSASKRGSVEFLGVAEAVRKQGHGEALLRSALCGLFCKRGAVLTELCVSAQNDSAAGLYQKVGFRAKKAYVHYRYGSVE